MLNMVWRGKTPDLSLAEAEAMGYAFMILPGVLTRTVVGACDAALRELGDQGRHPAPAVRHHPATRLPPLGRRRVGRLRTRFRDAPPKAAE